MGDVVDVPAEKSKGFEGQTAGARLYQKIVITGQADWKEVDLHFALAGGP